MGNVPKIRFQGFTEDWEQQKAGDVLIERNVQHAQSKEFPLVSFTVENGVTPKVDRYEREQLVRGDKKAKKYKETRLDDIVYNPANLKFGAIARNKYGNAVFSPIYITYEVNDRLALPAFIEMLVTRNRFIQNALRYQQGTVYERMAVNTEDFAALDMSLPSVEEQSKIGTLFNKLDSAIFMHKRKLDETQTLKQYLLRNMFPAPGEAVPAIRFEGFSGEWEEQKFDEMFEFLSNNTLSRAELDVEQGTVKNIHYGDILVSFDELIDVSKERLPYIIDAEYFSRNTNSRLQNGDVIIADTAEDQTVGKCAELLNVQDSEVVAGLHTMPCRPKKKFGTGFLGFYMNSPAFHDQLLPLMQGTKVTSISKSAITKTTISFPKDILEQQGIGTFFAELDENINHTKQKIAALNTLKQYLLQNMFPTKG